MRALALTGGDSACFLLQGQGKCNKKGAYSMTQNNNSWKKKYFILLAGQGVSFISSGVLQLAIIYYLVAETNSAIVLTAAALIGFLPQACLGPFAGAFVDRHSRKAVMIGADLGIAAAGGILALMALFMELPVWAIMAILLIRSTGTLPGIQRDNAPDRTGRRADKMRRLHTDDTGSQLHYQSCRRRVSVFRLAP